VAPTRPDRNLALELVRVTEAAALSAARLMGRGEMEMADRAAAEAMRLMLGSVEMAGTVAIAGSARTYAESLQRGDIVGSGQGPRLDVAVDPVDGIRLLAYGRSNALSVVAAAESGTLYDPGPVRYMSKIVTGRAAAQVIDITASAERNLWSIARALRKDVDDLTVVVLDRPRHEPLIAEIRATGARIRLLTDGDVAGALMAAVPETGVDVLLGSGGAPEGVMAACAVRCLSGGIQCRLMPIEPSERQAAAEQGLDAEQVLDLDRLVASDDVYFAATGITDGELLKGVTYHGRGAGTHSVSMRSRSGTVRWIEAAHDWEKLMAISQVNYHAIAAGIGI
jgi:fructose-1,6-bisphosphatase II